MATEADALGRSSRARQPGVGNERVFETGRTRSTASRRRIRRAHGLPEPDRTQKHPIRQQQRHKPVRRRRSPSFVRAVATRRRGGDGLNLRTITVENRTNRPIWVTWYYTVTPPPRDSTNAVFARPVDGNSSQTIPAASRLDLPLVGHIDGLSRDLLVFGDEWKRATEALRAERPAAEPSLNDAVTPTGWFLPTLNVPWTRFLASVPWTQRVRHIPSAAKRFGNWVITEADWTLRYPQLLNPVQRRRGGVQSGDPERPAAGPIVFCRRRRSASLSSRITALQPHYRVGGRRLAAPQPLTLSPAVLARTLGPRRQSPRVRPPLLLARHDAWRTMDQHADQ